MWPFTKSSNSSKITDDITKELPADLKQVFEKESHSSSLSGTKFIPERYTKLVNDKLDSINQQQQQITPEEELNFENYKINYSIKTVSQINCAEIENYLLECNKHPWYKFWAIPNMKASKDLKQCDKLTTDGLKFLNYTSCYNIKHCEFIRYHLDQIYLKNFGQLGENVNDKTRDEYYKDLHELFYKVWK